MPQLTTIIGLEIHVELNTRSKMFCGCLNNPFISQPNQNICAVCLAHPGTLPAANRAAIAAAVKIAKALDCSIAAESKFDRKHYFYPDLPKGYQISQYDQPIGERGKIILTLETEKNHRPEAAIGITRVHLEEDTAKLTHAVDGNTLVDFNRAGVPLVEIVSEPDIESAAEAKLYCQELQSIFRYLGVSAADMEKGQMRCEANVSVQYPGTWEKKNGQIAPKAGASLNPKVELKNINSFRAIEKAVEFEINRQQKMVEQGEKWIQQTRGWDEAKGETVLQRAKETAADYRYFPEPDIPPFSPVKIAGNVSLPELPLKKRDRFSNEYGFSYADSRLLTSDKDWAEYAEKMMSELTDWLHSLPETEKDAAEIKMQKKKQLARLAGGWLTSKLMGLMKERGLSLSGLKLRPENFAELIALIEAGRVNSTNAQKILVAMLDSGVDLDPTHVMEEKGYGQVSDEKAVQKIVAEVIKSYPAQARDFRAGKEPVLKFLIGMAMKLSEGSADPKIVEQLLKKALTDNPVAS